MMHTPFRTRLLIALAVLALLGSSAFAQTDGQMVTEFSIGFRYSKDQYTIAASASEGGVISPRGTRLVAAGEDITFSFTPAYGYRFAGLAIDGEEISAPAETTQYRFIRVVQDHTIHVSFEKINRDAEPTPSPAPTGSPTGQTRSPVTATSTALPGTVQTVTARPITGGTTTTVRSGSGGGGRRTATAVPSPSPSSSPNAADWTALSGDLPFAGLAPRNLGVGFD